MSAALLVELLTEELPPKLLSRIGSAFADGIVGALREQQFLADDCQVSTFATPRRVAVLATAVLGRQPDREIERKGPAKAQAFDAGGQPTQALRGFARSCGVEVDALETGVDNKGQPCFVFRSKQAGAALDAALDTLLPGVLARLPVAKTMRWGAGEAQFVRPVHGLVALHGERVLEVGALGMRAGRTTRGHRFLSGGPLSIPSAEAYAALLDGEGRVVAHFESRRERIRAALEDKAAGARLVWSEALLDEITSLVEWPVVYEGTFSESFLAVPQECLILSMQQHQKYVPLCDASGKLLPRFLLVSNLATPDPGEVVRGNERVLRARLSDAKFFFEQDQKTPLHARVAELGSVVYHNKLGSQLARVERLQSLARTVASHVGVDREAADRAARLCKADLLSAMVGEFPELQGIMGQYYAALAGETAEVAVAIEAHYHPRFAHDSLPASRLGACVALADKVDTLVGIYGIGQVPTGDKDPFGLRRQALGVVRILVEQSLPLDLVTLLSSGAALFPEPVVPRAVVTDLHMFVLERLRSYLRDRDFEPDEIESVVSQHPTRLDLVLPRLGAVRAFRSLPEASSLSTANKRVRNILRKTEVSARAPDPALLREPAEQDLFAAAVALKPRLASHLERLDYESALRDLATIRGEVDRFFDDVMVMAEDEALRLNRLALLADLAGLMDRVADISKLEIR
jgi:glycyl-tRNA synthetase beta chain